MTTGPDKTAKRVEWDSATYHRVSAPHVQWGRKVLARLTLRGNEHVLDAGCGTGKLTAELLDRLPQGHVTALDVSENMLGTARDYLQEKYRGRVDFVHSDLLEPPFTAFHDKFDGIFSTATFHWVLDHDALFRNLYGALRPGGWLCAQCGGGPNLAQFMKRVLTIATQPPFSATLSSDDKKVFYSDAESAAERLQRAGFSEVKTSVEAAPTTLEDAPTYREFISTVILRQYMDKLLSAELRNQFLGTLASLAAKDDPPFQLDYWRLNLWGRKQSA